VLKEGSAALLRRIPVGTRVFLPHMPSSDFGDVVSAAVAIQRAGLQPVPHVAARRWRVSSEAERALRTLSDALRPGSDGLELMVVGGTERSQRGTADGVDAPDAALAYNDSLDFISSGVLDGLGVRAVCLAAHPEGVSGVPRGVTQRALGDKAAALRDRGIDAHAVTQFCFDAAAVRELVAGLPALGISRARVGIVGPTSAATLAKYALACGVQLTAGRIAAEATRYSPEALIGEILHGDGDASANADRAAGSELALHIFPFGGLRPTLDWLAAAGVIPTS
jgi:methylenetetrahydrofolate reductase (NADPH)